MRYLLMNKDTPLVSFEINEELGVEVVRNEKVLSSVLPPWFGSVAEWLENRNYAKRKDHLKKHLSEWGMNTLAGFVDVTGCLGLNDTLWVKRENSSCSWDSVSLYRNDFSDVCEKTVFDTGLYGWKLQTTSPEFVTDGSFPKFWKKEPDGIYLYKFGMEAGYEPYCEYYASKIARQLCRDAVEYEPVTYKGKPCTRCALFTSEEVGLISLGKVMPESLVSGCTIPDVIDFLRQYGLSEKAMELFLIDSLTFNEDRHLNNIGLLFDNDTFEIIGLAPLFDFNRSMLCHLSTEDLGDVVKFEEYIAPGHRLGGGYSTVGTALARELGVNVKHISMDEGVSPALSPFREARFEQTKRYVEFQRDRIASV